jgi:aryl-alcohol dehydrogenase-like predicted oxidoreductase
MKYRLLGSSGIRVSEIGFGAWAIGGPVDLFGTPVGWGVVEDRQSKAAILRALELGVNFFDTADVYGGGHSEDLLGECLQGKDCVIATKVGNRRLPDRAVKDFTNAHILEAIEGSLRRLKRSCVDLYQLHNPPPEVWQSDEVFEILDRLKKEGKIRCSGVSISTMEEGIHLVENKKVDSLQVLFNILNQEPARKLLPLAEKNGVGIIVRVPLASGLLTGKFSAGDRFPEDDNRRNYLTPSRLEEALQKVERLKKLTSHLNSPPGRIALAFLLKFSAVTSAIPGAKTPAQVEQNVSASEAILEENLFETIRREFSDYNFFLRYHVRV